MADDGSVQLTFTKGHGTENDFVLVPDLDGTLVLDPATVRRLADRRAGIGGDGVIRVVPTRAVAEVADQAAQAEWFMDYRNADGEPAEMCGNGVRVFVTYLLREGLAHLGDGEQLAVATRAGTKQVRRDGDLLAVDLGAWRIVGGDGALGGGGDAQVLAGGLGGAVAGLSLDLGNPHTVVVLPGGAELRALDLHRAPVVEPLPPNGTNVEFVVVERAGHVAMRVHERGVGETRSCGTGAAAAALAARAWTAVAGGGEVDEWRVDVPGGTLRVRVLPSGTVELAGPAELVADGTVELATP
ncbi:diaminopimelate epimerase [Angustibacter sp. Root456]|uniref:diaminopimelate epimerase n=1 Tax=Angustibacter sp. Root456 TaxID=1736539 RepID=UPI000700D129|nr:diaminopimelate epimerase [Angustibacter sp. Root456]